MKLFNRKKQNFLIEYKKRLKTEEYPDIFIDATRLKLASKKTYREFSQELLNIGFNFHTEKDWAKWRLIVDEILQEVDMI